MMDSMVGEPSQTACLRFIHLTRASFGTFRDIYFTLSEATCYIQRLGFILSAQQDLPQPGLDRQIPFFLVTMGPDRSQLQDTALDTIVVYLVIFGIGAEWLILRPFEATRGVIV
jgi:hypothetical protein